MDTPCVFADTNQEALHRLLERDPVVTLLAAALSPATCPCSMRGKRPDPQTHDIAAMTTGRLQRRPHERGMAWT